MSYNAPPPPPVPTPIAKPRPGVVSAAVWLMYLVALLLAVAAVMGFMVAGATRDAFEQAYADVTDQATRDAAAAVASIFVIGIAVVLLLAAAGYAVLGYLDGKGSNPARIITWVLAGLSLCCLGSVVISAAAGGSFGNMGGGGTAGAPTSDELQRAMEEHLPSWYNPASTAVEVVALLASLVVIILLALPAANAFFRKAPPAFEPPPYPTS